MIEDNISILGQPHPMKDSDKSSLQLKSLSLPSNVSIHHNVMVPFILWANSKGFSFIPRIFHFIELSPLILSSKLKMQNLSRPISTHCTGRTAYTGPSLCTTVQPVSTARCALPGSLLPGWPSAAALPGQVGSFPAH